MKFLIDHRKNLIHKVVCAGDQCGFHSTPLAEREFTTSCSYLEFLREEKGYHLCSNCESSTIGPLYVTKKSAENSVQSGG